MTPSPQNPDALSTFAFETAAQKLAQAREEVAAHVFGQQRVIEDVLTALISGGHILLVGFPGLAKTRLVTVLSKVLGLDTKRLQCTPDLMPSDMIGAEILEEVDYGRRNFRFIQGPLFCQFLMVDEINRASPRTQSALLQAMQEGHVTVSGREHALPTPFHVLATQNPIDHEGTYPLPEAQLDRFLMQIDMTYPDFDSERRIVELTQKEGETIPRALIYANELRDLQGLVRRMPLPEKMADHILHLVRSGRPETTSLDIVKKHVVWGPGPRASRALALAVRARALVLGRGHVEMSDFNELLYPVLKHRIALRYTAKAENITVETIITAMKRAMQEV